MSAEVLLGKPVADAVRSDAIQLVEALAAKGKAVRVALLRVGQRPEDVAYERSLTSAAAKLGIDVSLRQFAEDVTTEGLLEAIDAVNDDDGIDGCLVFRPLPKAIDEARVCNAIAPEKDVDGVGASSLAGVFMGTDEGFAPATAEACIEMLDFYDVPIEGKRAVVVGRSLVIGKPVAMMLLGRDATVTLCHSRTVDLARAVGEADIVIAAVGRPRFFDGSLFRPGQVVLDVGINDDGAGGIVGDVDFDSAALVCRAITPVPRGVGSVSTAVLLRHVAQAAQARHVDGAAATCAR